MQKKPKRRTVLKSIGAAGFAQAIGLSQASDVAKAAEKQSEVQWHQQVSSTHTTPPTIDTEHVYVGAEDGLVALEKSTGKVAWRVPLSGGNANHESIVQDGAVFAPTFQSLFRIDAETGEREWKQHVGTGQNTAPVSSDTHLFIANGTDLRNETPGQLVAIDVASGNQTWTHEINGDIKAKPALDTNELFCGSTNGTLYTVDAAAGEVVWEKELNNPINTTPLVDGSRVYVHDEMGKFYVLDRASGSVETTQQLSPAWNGFEPTLANGTVVTAGRNGLYGLNQSGEMEWTTETAAPAMSLYAVGNHVFYGDTKSRVCHVEASSGDWEELTKFNRHYSAESNTLHQGIRGQPAVDAENLYAAIKGGQIVAIGISQE